MDGDDVVSLAGLGQLTLRSNVAVNYTYACQKTLVKRH